jgi:farnesyl-diphosphate farnesyltransferase
LAVKTIGLAYGNDAMFITNEEVKVSRAEVEDVIARCTTGCGDDTLLRADYEAMWNPVSRLMVAGSAMGEWPQGMDAA